MLLFLGGRELMVNVAGADVPAVVVTVIFAAPGLAIRLAGTLAVTCVALTNVVVSAVAFHCTLVPLMQFVPLTVRVNPAPPAGTEFGLRLLIVGGGGLMAKTAGADVPPLVVTVIFAAPGLAIRLAGTLAVTCVALTNVVVSAVAFHCTLVPLMQFVPLTVRVNPAPPAGTEFGLRLLIVGGGGLMAKTAGADVPPLVVTVIFAAPGLAIRLAGTLAVTCVALTNVVVSAVAFHCTLVPLMQFVPLTVRVNPAPPADTEFGLMLLIVGSGGLMVKTADADVPPLVVTVIFAEPGLAIRLAGTLAVTCVALTNVVVSAVAFHCTLVPLMQFVPLTVRVNPAPPAGTEFGLRLLIVGGGGLMAKTAGADVPPLVVTVIFAEPALAIRLAGTLAVTCVALTNVVVSAVAFHCTLAPLM